MPPALINTTRQYPSVLQGPGGSFEFPINPVRYEFKQGERATVTQTHNWFFIDAAELALAEITINGTTDRNGYETLTRLKTLWDHHLDGAPGPIEPHFFATTYDGEAYMVHMLDFYFVRAIEEEPLYRYTIHMVALHNLSNYGAVTGSGRDGSGGGGGGAAGGGGLAGALNGAAGAGRVAAGA